MNIKYRRNLWMLLPNNFHSCEVGCAESLFSEDIIKSGAARHYLIDAWSQLEQSGDGGLPQEWHDKNYEATIERMKPYGNRAVILKGKSDHMAHKIPDDSLDLVYIDCWHTYEGVKQDIASYWPKLKVGGVMSFHDFDAEEYGVKAAVLEFSYNNSLDFVYLPEDKKEDAGAYIIKR